MFSYRLFKDKCYAQKNERADLGFIHFPHDQYFEKNANGGIIVQGSDINILLEFGKRQAQEMEFETKFN